ncbi:MAG: hypothetical protein LBQ35_08375 [Spirochaetaceae bacterium]|jgi:hypothetical protein|nr:hypothetical protein [Spirochaetaceae bacterium]
MKATSIITEEEAEAMDEMLINTNIMPKAGKPGVLTRMGFLPGTLDPDVAEYLRAQAAATHRTQAQIASAIIREKIAATA